MAGTKKALALLVHGSRDPGWLEPFARLRDDVASRTAGVEVGLACLQFCHPTLAEEIDRLASRGAAEIVVVPIFISVRGHVLKDVPGVVEEARERFPGLTIRVSGAIGEQPEFEAAMRTSLVRMAGE
jgi:sirohydrochlorin cobaltochelatase